MKSASQSALRSAPPSGDSEGPSIHSEILRLCEERRDTLPAPEPQFEGEDEPLASSARVRGSEETLETIPAPPPSAAPDDEAAVPAPPTLPSWSGPSFDFI